MLKIPDIHNDKIVIDIIPTKAAIKKIMFNVSHLFRICICFALSTCTGSNRTISASGELCVFVP